MNTERIERDLAGELAKGNAKFGYSNDDRTFVLSIADGSSLVESLNMLCSRARRSLAELKPTCRISPMSQIFIAGKKRLPATEEKRFRKGVHEYFFTGREFI